MKILESVYERNKKWLYFALISTFVWGLAAHGYCFFDNSFSHDSLNELHSAILGNDIKIGSGRFLTPIYRGLLRSSLTMPWLIGLLALAWTGLSVFFTVKIFRVESRILAFLIAGAMSTNVAFSSTAATYIHDLDCYAFAVMCAAGAALLWRRYEKWGWLLGALPLMVTLGIYQSNLFVAVTLVVMASILDLLDGAGFQAVFGKGLKAVAMVVLATAAYYVTMQLFLALTGEALSADGYNSADLLGKLTLSDLPRLMGEAYGQTLSRLWNAYSAYPAILVKAATAGLFLLGLWALAAGMRHIGWKERLLTAALVLLLPLLVNFIYVITSGYCHDLMSWPTWLLWVLAMLLAARLKWQGAVCMLLVAGLLYGNVQFANGMYLKKDLEYDAYLSLMTRVAGRMETTEGYVGGETPVVVAGLPEKGRVLNTYAPGMTEFWNVTGMQTTDVIFSPERSRYQAYFDYVLGMPTVLAEENVWYETVRCDYVKAMPSFPDSGSIVMYNGMLIVKLGPVG